MVAIEHRSISSNTSSSSILSPTSNSSVNSATVSVTSTTSVSSKSTTTLTVNKKMSTEPETSTSSKSAVSQRQVEPKVSKKCIKAKNGEGPAASASGTSATVANKEDTKKNLKLDLKGKDNNDLESLKSPKSPIGGRLAHQNSLSSSVDLEDRKTLREALYQGIFHRHRRTIFAFGSFLRMLRSRNSQYNSIRSASEGEAEVEEVR